MKKIGITGGIGSGKSVVSRLLKAMGYGVYDSDSWAKHLMNGDASIKEALMARFGEETYTKEGLNRAYLAQQIFNNQEALAFVNSVVHPAVGRHFEKWCDEENSRVVFIESAILFSSGFDKMVDATIFVDAPQECRLARAMKRDNATTEAIMARIENQKKEEIYGREHADLVVMNDNKRLIIPQVMSIIENLI